MENSDRRKINRRHIARGHKPSRRIPNTSIYIGLEKRLCQRRIEDRREEPRRSGDLPGEEHGGFWGVLS